MSVCTCVSVLRASVTKEYACVRYMHLGKSYFCLCTLCVLVHDAYVCIYVACFQGLCVFLGMSVYIVYIEALCACNLVRVRMVVCRVRTELNSVCVCVWLPI